MASTEKGLSIREAIGAHMIALGQRDSRVVVVNADLSGACRNRIFVDTFTRRSFNVGIAEQNMVSFAAGLAHEGFLPYAFSMAPFLSMRACEQCRTDVAYANLPVRLMGCYAGVSGGISGATHWSIEDCGIMTAMPNMTVMEPSDATQACAMLDATLSSIKGPVYMRCTIEPCPTIYGPDYSFAVGKADVPRTGTDGAFICSGVTVHLALAAAKRIEGSCGAKVAVYDMHTIKPLDTDAIAMAARTGRVVVAQDHNVVGGLGQLVAAAIATEGIRTRIELLGVPDVFAPMAHAPYLYHAFGYDADGLEHAMLRLLGREE